MDAPAIRYTPQVIDAKARAIADRLLASSAHVRRPDFIAISDEDIATLFRLYDREFFAGSLQRRVAQRTRQPMRFRVSPRMTRLGGKTTIHRSPVPGGTGDITYEIAVASWLLFLTFADIARPVTIGGMVCLDRLQALQRLMEHEIIHLVELLEDGKSSCNQPRFKRLVHAIFGHTHVRHDLVLPEEHAARRHDIRTGSLAAFDFEGRRLVGRVNRITRRATILVKSPRGRRYSDGRCYAKYYVPLRSLRPVDERLAGMRKPSLVDPALHEPTGVSDIDPPPVHGTEVPSGKDQSET